MPLRPAAAVLSLLCLVVSPRVRPHTGAELSRPGADRPILLEDVHVIPMTADTVLRHQSVLVRDGRIAWSAPAGTREKPADTEVIEGRGRYVMPGLIDMHVHLSRADLPRYLESGITSVRNMWGHEGIMTLLTGIADGSIEGPTIYSASPGLDGSPPQWPATIVIEDPAQADSIVAAQVAASWRFIKVYTRLRPSVYDAIAASARGRGIRVIGHVPQAVDVRHALESGQSSIEHFTGYDVLLSPRHTGGTWGWADVDESRFAELAQATARAGTWNCPTLTVYVALTKQHPPEMAARVIANRRRFVKALLDAGAPLLAGTDAGIDLVPPGTSMHDELAELFAAGLTPYQALRAGTADAARFLGQSGLGVITTGARADLVLLSGNPLEDIRAVARPLGVMLRGRWTGGKAVGR